MGKSSRDLASASSPSRKNLDSDYRGAGRGQREPVETDEDIVDDVEMILFEEFRKHLGVKRDGSHDWERVFRMFDADNSGEILENEMAASLKKIGLGEDKITKKQLLMLIRRFDTKGRGRIDLADFIKFGEKHMFGKSSGKRSTRRDDDDDVIGNRDGYSRSSRGRGADGRYHDEDDRNRHAVIEGGDITIEVLQVDNLRIRKSASSGSKGSKICCAVTLLPWKGTKSTKLVAESKSPVWDETLHLEHKGPTTKKVNLLVEIQDYDGNVIASCTKLWEKIEAQIDGKKKIVDFTWALQDKDMVKHGTSDYLCALSSLCNVPHPLLRTLTVLGGCRGDILGDQIRPLRCERRGG